MEKEKPPRFTRMPQVEGAVTENHAAKILGVKRPTLSYWRAHGYLNEEVLVDVERPEASTTHPIWYSEEALQRVIREEIPLFNDM